MNNNTKLKWQGGLIGAIVMLFITFGGFAFGYGSLNSRVDEVEKKADKVYEIDKRLTVIETTVKNIDRKLQ